jgi:hypothetical protein
VRLALSELRESGASVLEGYSIGGVSGGEGVAGGDGRLHEQPPLLAPRHRLLVLDPRLRATHCVRLDSPDGDPIRPVLFSYLTPVFAGNQH